MNGARKCVCVYVCVGESVGERERERARVRAKIDQGVITGQEIGPQRVMAFQCSVDPTQIPKQEGLERIRISWANGNPRGRCSSSTLARYEKKGDT